MRACGYCREIGHTQNKCERKRWQIESILRHTAGERKGLHDLLLRNGIGVGAIFRQNSWGQEKEYVVTSMRNTIPDSFDAVVEYRIHKYKKSVRATLRCWTDGKHLAGEPDGYFIQRSHIDRIYVGCRDLNDMGSSQYCMFWVTKLEVRPEWTSKMVGQYYGYGGGEQPTILCPSSETDLADSDFMGKTRLHDRLGDNPLSGNNLWDPIMPS